MESPPGQDSQPESGTEAEPEPEPEQPPTYIGALALGNMAHGVVPLTRTHHVARVGLRRCKDVGKPPKNVNKRKQPQQTPAPTASALATALALGHVSNPPPPPYGRIRTRIRIRWRGVCRHVIHPQNVFVTFRGFPKKTETENHNRASRRW